MANDPVTSTALTAAEDPGQSISAFSSQSNFEAAQRMAKALATSSLVPEAYRNNIPNVLIAIELSARVSASVFAVMQNLDIIHGNPSWRAKFLIATVNACGRFTSLRWRWLGVEGTDSWGCRAVARELATNEDCIGPLVTIGMAKAEGWATKSGSKWKTMPELMLCYRSAAFWTRLYAPELSLGMNTAEETQDVHGEPGAITSLPTALVPGSTKDLEAELLAAPKPSGSAPAVVLEMPTVIEHDPLTGEIVPDGVGVS